MMRTILLLITIILLFRDCESEVTSDKYSTQFSETVADSEKQDLLESKEKISELDEKNQSLIKKYSYE
ncbi:hypothetical protein GC098_20300 [Paenibacillus sp. LMG 31458]|uniref:Uncharacterized protein n=1 Tax=Paenibacillus phytorum TaxID=2654977 RepID=A0ABX1Y129_9BACL|nr:hypothetical protein [Paenibacillus phytorum]NOU73733.1 hypothetical protein [Paenibacillus phytorum]